MFARILKWDEYEARDYHGRWTSGDFDDLDGLDNPDKFNLPPARYRGASDVNDYEDDQAKIRNSPKKVYHNDPKNLVDVFTQFKKDGGLVESHPTEMARKWKAVMGSIHPHEVLRAFLGKDGVSNHNFSQLALNIDEPNKRVSIATHGEESELDVHGAKAEAFSRFIHMGENKYVEHSLLKLAKADQGGNIAKTLFKSCLPVYDKLGIKHITVCANIDGGAYAWAKYGFEYFDSAEKKDHAQELKQAIYKHTKGVPISKEAQAELDAITKTIASRGSQTVWHLADIKTPHLDAQFQKVISANVKKKGTFMKLIFLGKELKGSRWAGKMNLDNASPARKRLMKYIGA